MKPDLSGATIDLSQKTDKHYHIVASIPPQHGWNSTHYFSSDMHRCNMQINIQLPYANYYQSPCFVEIFTRDVQRLGFCISIIIADVFL